MYESCKINGRAAVLYKMTQVFLIKSMVNVELILKELRYHIIDTKNLVMIILVLKYFLCYKCIQILRVTSARASSISQ